MEVIYKEEHPTKKTKVLKIIAFILLFAWIGGFIFALGYGIGRSEASNYSYISEKGDIKVEKLGFTCGTLHYQTSALNNKYEFTIAITIYNNSDSKIIVDAPSFEFRYKISNLKSGQDYSINNESSITLNSRQYRTITLKGYTSDSLTNATQKTVYYVNEKIGNY